MLKYVLLQYQSYKYVGEVYLLRVIINFCTIPIGSFIFSITIVSGFLQVCAGMQAFAPLNIAIYGADHNNYIYRKSGGRLIVHWRVGTIHLLQ